MGTPLTNEMIYLPIYDLKKCEDGVMYVSVERTVFINAALAQCDEPKKVVELLQKAFKIDSLIEEHVWLICLNNALKVIGIFEIAHGTADRALISPTNVYRRALYTAATSVIIAHNHTSGDVKPSFIDNIVTKEIIHAGKIIGIPLKDHIIIGNKGMFISMMERDDTIFKEETY